MSKEYVLDIGRIDGCGIARPSAIVDFMQELATSHAAELGLSADFMKENHVHWVLSRIKYTCNRPLYMGETIKLTTWPRQVRGASWYRDFIIEDGGGVIGNAVTVWAVVNEQTHQLVRPQTLNVHLKEQIVGQPEMLRGIRTKHLEPCFDRVVRYSDIDINQHLNNVKAVDILSDAFGLEDNNQTSWVSQMQVNYVSETLCGTKLTLARGRDEQGLCVSAMDGDKENVQARVIVSAIDKTEGGRAT